MLRAEQNPAKTALAVFDIGEMIPRIHQKLCADLVTASCHPEQARVVVVTAAQYGISPRASKFCFLKLPIVFGYVVPFAAISKKQNRKGSSRSLIYPLKGKLAFFMIKQFFAFGREHQTLMRSRLRRFCSERCIAANTNRNADYFYAAVCTLLSPQNFDSPFGLPQDDMLTLEALPPLTSIPRFQKQLAVFDVGVIKLRIH